MALLAATSCTSTTSSDARPSTHDVVVAAPTTRPPLPPEALNACEWVTPETVFAAVVGPVTSTPFDDRDQGNYEACTWRGAEAELSVYFTSFGLPWRSVEAEISRISGDMGQDRTYVNGIDGAFRRPGVWYGRTPLNQYGMAEFHLVMADGSDPVQAEFEVLVSTIIDDVRVADPAVPWLPPTTVP